MATVHVKTGTLAATARASAGGATAVISPPTLSHVRRMHPPAVVSHLRDNHTHRLRVRFTITPSKAAGWVIGGVVSGAASGVVSELIHYYFDR